jgi:hypothetical protein
MRTLPSRSRLGALRRPFFLGGLLAAPIAAAVLVACGGGGSGTSSPPPGSGGEGANSVASGTLTGLGSIYVNGIEYDDSTAKITDDFGRMQPASALKLGMQVEMSGIDPSTSGGMGHAGVVVFSSNLEGPVDSSDATAGTITLLGQTVQANVNTVWDAALTGGIGGLTAGELLKVYALYDSATGRYVASRIEPDAGITRYKLRGAVSNLDTTKKTYTVGPTTVDYSGLADVPADLADGKIATAELQTTMGANGWIATGVQLHNDGMPGNHVNVHVRGMVADERSPTSFRLDGWPVDASGATFPAGQGVIVQGAAVQVDGIVTNGAVIATTVDLQEPGAHHGLDFQVHGPIDGMNGNRHTFVLRGTLVSYAGDVAFSGGSAADLAIGTKVLVQGKLAADGNTVQAVKIAINQ